MKKVVVFSTGGTIAMKMVPGKGVVPACSGADLVEAVPGLASVADIEVRDFSNIPSCQMTPALMFSLAGQIRETLRRDDVTGCVVTHGTDTVEETAYLLDCVLREEKPVALTCALRSASGVSPDGPANILCALRVACSGSARGLGVVVVMNERIFPASDVIKTHSVNPDAFQSPWWGPLGYVDGDEVIVRRLPAPRAQIAPERLGGEVFLLKMYAGCSPLLVETLVKYCAAGIVIEGFGRGNMPPLIQKSLAEAVKAGIPVVVCTRSQAGRTLDEYGYEGGGRKSREAGFILTGEISGPKARLRLMLVLGLTRDMDRIRSFFEPYAR